MELFCHWQGSVMPVSALAVIGENFDDPALVDTTMPASLDHKLQFDFQSGQTSNPLLDLDKASFGNGIGRNAGLMRIVLEDQKRSNGIDIETQFTGMPDERETPDVRSLITALIALASIWRDKQTDALIIADGWHFDAAFAGRVTDRDFFHHFSLAPLVARGCRKVASV